MQKPRKAFVLELGKAYIVEHNGQRQQWESIRTYTDHKGRTGYMGVTRRGVLLAITNCHKVLGEINTSPILYSEWRATGLEKCMVCSNLYTANSPNFPMTYSHGETTSTAICGNCLRTELNNAKTDRKETIRTALFIRYKETLNRNIMANF